MTMQRARITCLFATLSRSKCGLLGPARPRSDASSQPPTAPIPNYRHYYRCMRPGTLPMRHFAVHVAEVDVLSRELHA